MQIHQQSELFTILDMVGSKQDNGYYSHKIEAIKWYREHHNVGLKEAKDVVELIIKLAEPPRFTTEPMHNGYDPDYYVIDTRTNNYMLRDLTEEDANKIAAFLNRTI